MSNKNQSVVVCAMYKFVRLPDHEVLRAPLLEELKRQGISGTLLLAQEGINGTVAGSREAINALLNWFKHNKLLADIDYKESYTDKMPFKRTKVKLKKEIVTMGIEGIDPQKVVGTYVEPEDWNALISDPDVVLVDTRNDYEFQVGSFKNALNPQTDSFREFPAFAKKHIDPGKHRKVAMFCTGGIRCEKSTAFMKEHGFEEVYHLKGGILNYLEKVPEDVSLWQGECFVFDDRVTVDHSLQRGSYDQCNACRLPITAKDKQSEHYEKGVSCPHCYDTLTEKQRQRFAERERQMQLARQRGESHLGSGVDEIASKRRQRKYAKRNQQRAQDI